MTVWPATLPQSPLIEGYKESPPNLFISSPMDYGPEKTRKRTSAASRPITVQWLMTGDQVDDFDDFYRDYGAVSFDWTEPRTGNTVTAKFKSGSVPSYMQVSGNKFIVKAEVVILP
jgi:hypothetical protein